VKIIGNQEVRPTGRNSVIVSFQLDFNDPAGTYVVCPVRPNQAVVDAATCVRTAFNATSPSCTLGDSNASAGYLANADVALATAATASVPAVKRIGVSGEAYANGKVYAAADNVTLTWAPGTSGTAGKLVGWVELVDLSLDSVEA